MNQQTDLFANAEIVMRHFLRKAVDIIDAQFGPDSRYARTNPRLVAEIAMIGAQDYFESCRALRESIKK
jgi:hypothetical protein